MRLVLHLIGDGLPIDVVPLLLQRLEDLRLPFLIVSQVAVHVARRKRIRSSGAAPRGIWEVGHLSSRGASGAPRITWKFKKAHVLEQNHAQKDENIEKPLKNLSNPSDSAPRSAEARPRRDDRDVVRAAPPPRFLHQLLRREALCHQRTGLLVTKHVP